MTRVSPLGLAVALGSVSLLASPSSHAGGDGIEVSLNALGAVADIDSYKLHVALGTDQPDPLKDKDLRLDGLGSLFGGELRLALLGSSGSVARPRGGLGFGFFGVDHIQYHHDALQRGVDSTAGTLWGMHTDLFFGSEFQVGAAPAELDGSFSEHRKPFIIPYVDIRFMFTLLQTQLKLHYDPLGDLGSTTYNAYSFGIGPRAGVMIPMGSDVFIDVGAYGNLFGLERVGGYAGIGIWDR
jgi:hypothetical protein